MNTWENSRHGNRIGFVIHREKPEWSFCESEGLWVCFGGRLNEPDARYLSYKSKSQFVFPS
jgi:hypothetical protein